MSRKLCLISAVALIAYMIIGGDAMRALFSPRIHIETPFGYVVNGKDKSARPGPLGIDVGLPDGPRRLTTLHLSAWILGPGTLSVSILDETDNLIHKLAERPVLRHIDFDLTQYVQEGKKRTLRVMVMDPDNSSAVVVQELVVSRMPELVSFPRFDLFLLLFALGLALFGKLPVSLFVFLTAFSVRWHALAGTVGHPLEGDAIGYYLQTGQFDWAHMYSTGMREPLYIWLQAAMSYIWGNGHFAFRVTTVLLSAGCATVGFILARDISKRTLPAAVAACLMSFGQFVVWNSTRGERGELYSLLFLLFCLGVLRLKKSGWKTEALLGWLSGLVSLTWLVGGVACCSSYIYRWWNRKIKPVNVLIFLGVLVCVVIPHLAYQWEATGDPFRSLNVHASFYKTAQETGTPSYEDQSQTMMGFILGQGPKLVFETLSGFARLLLDPREPFNKIFLGFHYTQNYSFLLYPFLLLGLFFSICDKNALIFWLFFSVMNVSIAFMAQVRDPRLFLQAQFFMAYFLGAGVDGSYRYLTKRKGKD